MARIKGVDIPDNKRIEIALTYIFGIGRSQSLKILAQTNINKANTLEVQVKNKLSKDQAQELLSMYNPNVKYIYQGTENEFEVLKEKGLEGYVFLPEIDTDLGMFVNKDTAKIYYFHPSGYLELAQ